MIKTNRKTSENIYAFYGLPKVNKPSIPMSVIKSGIDSARYNPSCTTVNIVITLLATIISSRIKI